MPSDSRHRVAVLPGDGIGPSVVEAACQVLDATGAKLAWEPLDIGVRAYDHTGQALPEDAIETIRAIGVALKGPLETRPDLPFTSVNVGLRRALGLNAQFRPVQSWRGTPSRYRNVDLIVARETTEDLYRGIEFDSGTQAGRDLVQWLMSHGHDVPADSGFSLKPISPGAVRAFLTVALAQVRKMGRRRITLVHKAAVMRATDALFLREAEAAGVACPDLVVDSMTVDAMASALVRHPEDYDVVLTMNQYGDILSDLASGLIGGVGLAPGVNLGPGVAVFEAAHGTAPRHVNRESANPLALVLCGAMLLDHLGEARAAARVRSAVSAVVEEGTNVTRDLRRADDARPAVSTDKVARAVIDHL